MWTRSCQREFPTTQVYSVGKTLADYYDVKRFVYIFSIVVFVLPFGFHLLLFACIDAFTMIFFMIEIVFQIVLIIYQSKTIVILKTINPFIKYAVENSCSDGPMQAAFKTINDNISQDMTKVAIGLGFTVFSLLGLLFFMVTACSIGSKKN